jgi:hypothetical protein
MDMTSEDMALCAALLNAAVWYENEVRRSNGSNGFVVGKAAICRDIERRVLQRGAFASERQRAYAQALVRWTQPRQARLPAASEPVSGVAVAQSAVAEARATERQVLMSTTTLQRIVQLFAAATLHGLRYPKIRLQRGEWKIRIYPAPRSSRNAGSYYVKARSGTTRREEYMGRIQGNALAAEPLGTFVAHPACSLDVIEALREFAENPLQVAAAYGHATSACCFCGRTLTDARSVAMGYGPVCAEHFGLEWGEQRAVQSTGNLTEEQLRAASDEVTRRQEAYARREMMRPAFARRRRRYGSAPEYGRSSVVGRPTPTAPTSVPLSEEDEDKHFM